MSEQEVYGQGETVCLRLECGQGEHAADDA
jgi:hypothetical protein